ARPTESRASWKVPRQGARKEGHFPSKITLLPGEGQRFPGPVASSVPGPGRRDPGLPAGTVGVAEVARLPPERRGLARKSGDFRYRSGAPRPKPGFLFFFLDSRPPRNYGY